MRITDVKVQAFSHSVPVQWAPTHGKALDVAAVVVVTDEGLEGYSMGRLHGGAPGAVLGQEIASVVKPRVVGADPLDRERIWQDLWNLGRRDRLSIYAISCIDVALWDIAGKAANMPVYKLLGGFRDKVPAYASSGMLPTVEDYIEEALSYQARGYKGYKLHPFGIAEKDVKACAAVRRAVGDSMALMVDPAGSYDLREAMWVGRRLEDLSYYWYEEPLADFDIAAYAELCRALDIPILSAEVVPGSIYLAAQYLNQGATDIMRADVYWKGGITAVIKLAHMAEAFGRKLEVHHGASAVMDWANLHVLGGFKNGDFLEVLVPAEPYHHGLKEYVQVDSEGFAHLPQRPGLGVELDWDYINANTTFRA